MIVVTFGMICKTVTLSSILGIVSGIIYALFSVVRVLWWRHLKKGKNAAVSYKIEHSALLDFLFFSLLSLFFILLNYAFCDGAFYLYPIAFLAVSFLFTYEVIRRIFKI